MRPRVASKGELAGTFLLNKVVSLKEFIMLFSRGIFVPRNMPLKGSGLGRSVGLAIGGVVETIDADPRGVVGIISNVRMVGWLDGGFNSSGVPPRFG